MFRFVFWHPLFLNELIFVDDIKSLRGKTSRFRSWTPCRNRPSLVVRPLNVHNEAIIIRCWRYKADDEGRKIDDLGRRNPRNAVRHNAMTCVRRRDTASGKVEAKCFSSSFANGTYATCRLHHSFGICTSP